MIAVAEGRRCSSRVQSIAAILLEALFRVKRLDDRPSVIRTTQPPVPDALWDRRKQGFTLPFDRWLSGGGIPLRLPRHECLRRDALDRIEQQYRAGQVHWSRVWLLHVLAEFLD